MSGYRGLEARASPAGLCKALMILLSYQAPRDGDAAGPGGHTLITGLDTLIKVWNDPHKYW